MSDEVKATPEPVTAPAAAAVVDTDPKWLPERLEREREKVRKQFLSELGVEKADDAKKALADFKAKQDADKSELQKLIEQNTVLGATAKRAAELESVVKVHAERALAGLTDAQKAAVTSLAGEDYTRIVSAIDALRPTWASTTETAPPANTSPSSKAPQAAEISPPSHRSAYEALKQSNPFAAATYRFTHFDAINAETNKQ